MVLSKLSSKLIHLSIQKDEMMLVKARTLLVLLLFLLVILITYTSFFIFNGILFNSKSFLNYLGVFIVIFSLLLLKTSTNLIFPLRILSYSSIVLITGGVYYSGGFASNDIFWYVVAATASLLFIGKLDGIIITILSVVAIIAFYVIELQNLIELPFDLLTNSLHYRFANALVIVVILFFLMWLLVNRNNQLQEVIREIQNSHTRDSISQDFHDELGNKLASVVHLSKRLRYSNSDEEKAIMLNSIEKESQQVYDNFRDFIWSNESSNLTAKSLFIYLIDFNQHFFAYKEIQVEGQLISLDNNEEKVISQNTIRHLIPLFKELMTNIYKHANASQVNWSLTVSKLQIILKVTDNGSGFDVNETINGSGLKSINKRVKQMNANFDIQSRLGNGTQTILKID